jgi:uncharacterized protein YkwD
MMSKTFTLVAVLSASAALADDAVTSPMKTGDGTPMSVSTGTPQEPPTQQVRPLHRHPTLFGMLQRNNSMRRRVGLFPHRMNPSLAKAAQDHANYMARTGQFNHYVNGGPQSRANKYGFAGGGVRENIAMGTRTIEGAFSMWQNSGAHYASIVSGTTDAGFGYAVGPNGMSYFVGIYGSASPGDGETEEHISKFLEEEKRADEILAAEKAAAEKDPNIKSASATLDPEQKPVSQVQPAAATESAEGK